MHLFSINTISDLEYLAKSEEVEFKLAHCKDGKSELPKDFWKTYSTMVNTYGGWIILGVKKTQFSITPNVFKYWFR